MSPLGWRACWSGTMLLAWLALAGCAKEPDAPEQQVRAYVAAGEMAVQERQLDQAKALISPDYRDEAGRGRRELVQLLAVHLLRNKSIHLFTRIEQLHILEPQQRKAEIILFAAMAGSPITGIEQLTALRADLYRFELLLGKDTDEQWLLLSVRWRHATPQELIH